MNSLAIEKMFPDVSKLGYLEKEAVSFAVEQLDKIYENISRIKVYGKGDIDITDMVIAAEPLYNTDKLRYGGEIFTKILFYDVEEIIEDNEGRANYYTIEGSRRWNVYACPPFGAPNVPCQPHLVGTCGTTAYAQVVDGVVDDTARTKNTFTTNVSTKTRVRFKLIWAPWFNRYVSGGGIEFITSRFEIGSEDENGNNFVADGSFTGYSLYWILK